MFSGEAVGIMNYLFSIIFGIIQGITEFLPVSSAGHVAAISKTMGLSYDSALLFETVLHVGTLGAVFYYFQKDIRKIFFEFIGIILDLVSNLYLWLHNRRAVGHEIRYGKIVDNVYRKFTVMLLVTCIPTALIGYSARNLAVLASRSEYGTGIAFLVTSLWLLVISLSGSGGIRTPKEAGYDSSMWIGICQGLSVFPGISRCGMTVGAGLMCGFTRRMAVKYSYIASIPAIIGALIVEIPSSSLSFEGAPGIVMLILGMLFSGITGYFLISITIRLVTGRHFRYFAVYCLLAGIVMLLL